MLLKAFCVFPSHLATFEAEFDANPLLLHVSCFSRSVRSQNSANVTSQKSTKKNTHVLAADCHLAECFMKGTARNTQQHTTVLQAVFWQHPNCRDFWVAPCIVSPLFVSVVSPVWLWLSLSLWAEVPSSSNECASESDSHISYLMCWSVWFLLVAMLLNALGPNLAHTKCNPFWLIVFKTSAFPGLSHVVITLTWNRFKCWVEDTHKHEPTFQKSQEEIHTGEWRTFACGPKLH
jgi:hypothetical protein